MNMKSVYEQIGSCGIVPVVVIENSIDAVPLVRALKEGGLTCVEVTLRTDQGLQAIKNISKADSGMTIGAGTVLTVNDVKSAVDAGATFIVSPGLNPSVVEYCLTKKIPVIPGISTPSEATRVIEYGLEVAKFFPAEASGGVPYLKALSAPFGALRFIPTGGIREDNLLSYLRLPFVIACGGSWMVASDLVNQKQFDTVKRLSAQAVGAMLGFDLRHIGVNCDNPESALKESTFLSNLLSFPTNDRGGSIFVGTQFELLKSHLHGVHGHIAIGTNFIDRAVDFLARRGVSIRPETRAEKDGRLSTVYLDVDIAGFAVHLLQL
jgi:2-dehydro-3-deoxyphosphogluconate aldolase/(4S)-4-hydroxy-2-oxoglutarate aldolase